MMLARACRRCWKGLLAVDRFVRIHFLFFSCLLPLLGASTVRRDLEAGEILALIGAGICFHIYSYVLNDVIDLPVDRTHPSRQRDPLVSGKILPWQALVLALVQIPLTWPLTAWLGGSGRANAVLAAGFVLMGVYNLWGKRCPVPPLTDAAQGLGWGSLALWGALAIGGAPNLLTWMIALYAAGFLLQINGIHGGLRDLANDLARGARTTAIFLGARPGPDGGTRVPPAVSVFAFGVLAGLIALGLLPLLRNDFGYSPALRTVMLGLVAALDLVSLCLLWTVLHPSRPLWNVAFRVHCFHVAATLIIVFVPYVSGPTLTALLALVTASLLPLEWTAWLQPSPSSPGRNAAADFTS